MMIIDKQNCPIKKTTKEPREEKKRRTSRESPGSHPEPVGGVAWRRLDPPRSPPCRGNKSLPMNQGQPAGQTKHRKLKTLQAYHLRELPTLPSSWRCAREGRVGSGGRVVAGRGPNVAVGQILGLQYQLCTGTLQNWLCWRGIYSDKAHQEHVGFSVEIVLLLAKEQYFE